MRITSASPSRLTGRTGRAVHPPEIRDRIPGFHTDFTQNDRSGPHTLRHPGQTTNAQMPMNTQKAAHSAGFLADPPSVDYQQVVRLYAYSWGILGHWFSSVLHVDPPCTVKKLEIRWKSDVFLSRIGGLNPGIPGMARPLGGSHVLTDIQWHSSRIWQGGAGFPYPISHRSASAGRVGLPRASGCGTRYP